MVSALHHFPELMACKTTKAPPSLLGMGTVPLLIQSIEMMEGQELYTSKHYFDQ